MVYPVYDLHYRIGYTSACTVKSNHTVVISMVSGYTAMYIVPLDVTLPTAQHVNLKPCSFTVVR